VEMLKTGLLEGADGPTGPSRHGGGGGGGRGMGRGKGGGR
jgi:hypothetical protein